MHSNWILPRTSSVWQQLVSPLRRIVWKRQEHRKEAEEGGPPPVNGAPLLYRIRSQLVARSLESAAAAAAVAADERFKVYPPQSVILRKE